MVDVDAIDMASGARCRLAIPAMENSYARVVSRRAMTQRENPALPVAKLKVSFGL
jgi:hypothetical protein